MTIDPTRKEWDEAYKRVRKSAGCIVNLDEGQVHRLTEAALGCPCPPEPAPREWRSGGIGTLAVAPHAHGGVCVGFALVAQERLTPDEARAMAAALTEQADYTGGKPSRSCERSRPSRATPSVEAIRTEYAQTFGRRAA